MDLTNTTLGGRYRLGAVIGTGGMSDVYAATDELLGRDVAVKMMRADLARDETFLERFRREAKNAAKLNHHAIVAVYDTGQTSPETGSVPYIVMERVHGSTLREIIRDSGPLPLSEAGRVMAEVCRALSFSHEAGIIHRDVKPANIMITNTGAVKVMDFGIAQGAVGLDLRDDADLRGHRHRTVPVAGTGARPVRGRPLRHLRRGLRLLRDHDGASALLRRIPVLRGVPACAGRPGSPSTLPGMRLDERQSLALDSVVLTAMAKDPTDRYDTADQMASDLRAVAERRMPMAAINYTGDQEVGQQSPDTESTTVFPQAGAAAAGAGLAGAAGAAAGPRASGTAAAPAAPAPRASGPVEGDDSGNRKKKHRASTIAWIVALVALLGVGGVVAYNLVSGDGVDSSETQVSVPDVEGPAAGRGRADTRGRRFQRPGRRGGGHRYRAR
ncbi:non-specific serine/threonine protein kinase OS=Corynebacterium variabile OX=1727 GN=pknB PE=4 SV=1 [Corynebacterium variabile]